ncbi:hypothetical protein CR194_03190 [Salipaludibacillus keqinensis]|uniref:DUF2515 domain-containing protein n=1 Tax=Salipaludibacillus keqinensis TaxID=2045207 RepID=A0A323THF0_9BACI|nr:DUF2515 family protein [Salipaludibacillus keqinensis]PYZ94552.1 hypothetical protein CR194_03190 [Salipaludibacillus keqinensis]
MNKRQILKTVRKLTAKNNVDNVARTDSYQQFYDSYPEIRWAYLASFVSRNAGWSMSDLLSHSLVEMLSKEWRRRLFISLERANWLIFSDAYPQLMIYQFSQKIGKPLFDLLSFFDVSKWMMQQWWVFWYDRNEDQLMKALIINEQHVIEKPVIRAPFFRDVLFHRPSYEWQERLHFSVVIFPSICGEIYGISVDHFTDVKKRVELGGKLAWLLFHSPVREEIREYFQDTLYTGNRSIDIPEITHEKDINLPLRICYPMIHHGDNKRRDWSLSDEFEPDLLLRRKNKVPRRYQITDWYQHKQHQIHTAAKLSSYVRGTQKKNQNT